MALAFLDNISYKGKMPNFERDQFETLEQMKNFSDNYLPQLFIATCIETGKIYLYNKSNTPNETLGKWREFTGGGSSVSLVANPTGGVDLTVGGEVVTLAKEDDLEEAKVEDITSNEIDTLFD